MTTTAAADLLADFGRALYGPEEWLSPLGRRIGVNPRTLRNWLNGKKKPDPDAMERARRILIEARDLIPRFDALKGRRDDDQSRS
jgi:hypothetical protein